MKERSADPTGRSQRRLRCKKKKLQPLAFWGPFSSLSCRTFPRCAYAPTYHLPILLPDYPSGVRLYVRVRILIVSLCERDYATAKKCESRISARGICVSGRGTKSSPFYNRVTEHLRFYIMREETFFFFRKDNFEWN